MFKKAERKQAKLRLALTGPSGSGKTYSALRIAKGIGGNIAVLDTEHGSASLYSDIADFDVCELGAPFTPERYIEIIKAAEKGGYDVLIIDSMTHEWNGDGGVLDINTKIANTEFKGNTFAAWSKTTPRHNRFIETILQANLHVIVTMRSKQDFILPEGSKTPKKVGLAPVQRDGLEYEFTTVLDLSIDNLAVASKDRTRLFAGDPEVLTEEHGEKLVKWLNSGKSDRISQEQSEHLYSRIVTLANLKGKSYDEALAAIGSWYEGKKGQQFPDLSQLIEPAYDLVLGQVDVLINKEQQKHQDADKKASEAA